MQEERERMGGLDALRRRMRRFVRERDWEQFHSPKNLSMALIAEAAELIEHFQWLTQAQSRDLPPETLRQVTHELADIQLYLVRIADQLGIDLVEAANRKMDLNERKYPAERVRGSARKYTDYP